MPDYDGLWKTWKLTTLVLFAAFVVAVLDGGASFRAWVGRRG